MPGNGDPPERSSITGLASLEKILAAQLSSPTGRGGIKNNWFGGWKMSQFVQLPYWFLVGKVVVSKKIGTCCVFFWWGTEMESLGLMFLMVVREKVWLLFEGMIFVVRISQLVKYVSRCFLKYDFAALEGDSSIQLFYIVILFSLQEICAHVTNISSRWIFLELVPRRSQEELMEVMHAASRWRSCNGKSIRIQSVFIHRI